MAGREKLYENGGLYSRSYFSSLYDDEQGLDVFILCASQSR